MALCPVCGTEHSFLLSTGVCANCDRAGFAAQVEDDASFGQGGAAGEGDISNLLTKLLSESRSQTQLLTKIRGSLLGLTIGIGVWMLLYLIFGYIPTAAR